MARILEVAHSASITEDLYIMNIVIKNRCYESTAILVFFKKPLHLEKDLNE